MALPRTVCDRTHHAAARTSEFLFNQLIPYIGNKRKLLRLIQQAVEQTGVPPGACFVDFFADSGVVARWAKLLGYRVIANDWEPYSQVINRCYIACNRPPVLRVLGRYERTIEQLNRLPPVVGWVTEHLCPRDDLRFDIERDRMFRMRKNGMRIDAIREQIAAWKQEGAISDLEEACLLAPLVYQAGLLHQQHEWRLQGVSQRLGRSDIDGALSRRGRPGVRSSARHHPCPFYPHQLQHRWHDPAGRPAGKQRSPGTCRSGDAGL